MIEIYARSNMIKSAILKYSLSLDICWQIIWAYFQPSSLSMLLDGRYGEMEKLCTSSAVHEQLNCIIGLHGIGSEIASNIKSLLAIVENEEAVTEIRTIYNYIKHRGTIHIEGLGDNPEYLSISINTNKITKQSRPSYSIAMLTTVLLDFDDKVADLIEKLYELLLPKDYIETKCSFVDFVNSAINISYTQGNKENAL